MIGNYKLSVHSLMFIVCREQVLDVVGQVSREYQAAKGIVRTQLCRALLALLLYTAIPPGRSKEYRELKFKYHNQKIQGSLGEAHENVLNYSDNEVWLYITDHKTSESIGSQVIKCPQEHFVNIVKEYIESCRSTLPDCSKSDILFLVSQPEYYVRFYFSSE